MFSFNDENPKKFRESLKYLERKARVKLSIDTVKAYLLNDVGFIVLGTDIYQYSLVSDSLSNMVKNLYLILIDVINLRLQEA